MKTQKSWMTGVFSAVLSMGVYALCLAPRSAQANLLYWDFGANPDTLWSTAANWDTAPAGGVGSPGIAPGTSDIAVFNVSSLNSAQTITLNAPQSIGGLVFTNTGTTRIQAVSSARVVTLGTGGVTVTPGSGAVTIGHTTAALRLSFILGGNQSWINNCSSLLTFSFSSTTPYGIDNSGYTLTIDGSGNIATSAGTAPLSGSGGLVKNGAGTFSMGMDGSTFTGPVTLNAGTLNANTLANINTACSLGKGSGSAADLVFGGGTLRHDAANAVSSDRLFTIGNANGLTAAFDSSATLAANTMSFTSGGALSYGSSGARIVTLTGGNIGANTFNPIIGDGPGGPTALAKNGLGTWILSGANTYAGGTTLSAGTLKLSGSGTLGASSGSLTLTGGSLDLGGSSQSVGAVRASGGTVSNGIVSASSLNLQSGMLQLDFSPAPRNNILSLSQGFTLENGGGLITKGTPGSISTQSFASVTIGEGLAQIWNQPNGSTSNVLNLGAISTTLGGGLFITNSSGGFVTTTTANDEAGILSGRIVYKDTTWTEANFASRNGDGIIRANANYITAATTFTPLTGNNYTIIGHGTLLAGGTIHSLRMVPIQTNRALNMDTYSLILSSGGLLLAADGNYGYIITNGTLTVGSGNELIINQYSRAALICAALITDNGSPVSVNLVGTNNTTTASPLILGFNNTYSGGTFINSNTALTATYPQSLGTGFVKLNGGKLQLAVPLTISSNLLGIAGSVIDLGTNTLTVSQGGNSTYAGLITSTGALIKAGAGALTLSATNNYAGGTTIEGGTLLVSNTEGVGAGTNNLTVKTGATLGGTGLLAGMVTIENGGTLNAGSTGAVGTLTVSNLTLSSGSTLAVNIASASSADRIVVTGSTTPAGALVITPVGGYNPAPGEEWTILTGTVSPGSFSSITPGYEVTVGAGSLVVKKKSGVINGTVIMIK